MKLQHVDGPACGRRAGRLFRAAASIGFIAAVAAMTLSNAAQAQMRMWVTGDGLRRTCPSAECGVVGRFFHGESVFIYESIDGWSRVSAYYTAGCYEGRSSLVMSGRDDCTASNGIRDGEFAEWVSEKGLSAEDPQLAG